MFHPKETRGFIFPFVMFFITAWSFIMAGIFSFENAQTSYDALFEEQKQVQDAFSSEVFIFESLLQQTNSNSLLLSATGSDNDNYSKTGSGWSGTDDDEEAFVHKLGSVEAGTMKNILYLNPTYNSYASLPSLSSLTAVQLTTSSTWTLSLYALDGNYRMLKRADFPLISWTNTISLSDWTNAHGLALFLKNDTWDILKYTCSGIGGNIVWARNLGGGNYEYYANFLIPKDQGQFSFFARLFTK